MEEIRHLFDLQVFVLALVLGVYISALWLYRTTRISLLHPVLTTIAVLIAVLKLFDIGYETFRQGSNLIDFLLGPCVVALGLTLYEQVEHIRKNLVSMLTAILVGSITGIVSVVLIARWMGAGDALVASLEPKSVTTPIAISISQQFGGIPAITAVVVCAVGIFGGIVGPFILNKLGIDSKIARGLAMGASAHGLGTARAIELGALEGAISGLAIGLMGIATAIMVPVIRFCMTLFG
jgi:predicted murein hydrolase (TIGR00659 family)